MKNVLCFLFLLPLFPLYSQLPRDIKVFPGQDIGTEDGVWLFHKLSKEYIKKYGHTQLEEGGVVQFFKKGVPVRLGVGLTAQNKPCYIGGYNDDLRHDVMRINFYRNGSILSHSMVKDGKIEGLVSMYSKKGRLLAVYYFENNRHRATLYCKNYHYESPDSCFRPFYALSVGDTAAICGEVFHTYGSFKGWKKNGQRRGQKSYLFPSLVHWYAKKYKKPFPLIIKRRSSVW